MLDSRFIYDVDATTLPLSKDLLKSCINSKPIFSFVLCKYENLITTINSGQVSPACGIPMYYIQSAPLICFVVCAFRIVQRWFLEWHNFLQNDDLKMWPSKIHPENGSEK